MSRNHLISVVAMSMALACLPLVSAQERLKSMPGSDQYEKMNKLIPGSVQSGALTVVWKDGGKAFEYAHGGSLYRYDIVERKAVEIGKAKGPQGAGAFKKGGGLKGAAFKGNEAKGGGFVARGRQATSDLAPSGKL